MPESARVCSRPSSCSSRRRARSTSSRSAMLLAGAPALRREATRRRRRSRSASRSARSRSARCCCARSRAGSATGTGAGSLVIGGAFVVAVRRSLYPLASEPRHPRRRSGCFGGLGEAAFFVGAATMITDLAPIERRGEAISYWSVAVYSGLAFGPLGEVVLDAADYDAVWIVVGGARASRPGCSRCSSARR